VKLDDGAKCQEGDVRVYRQSREAGRGCLVSIPDSGGAVPSSRYYWWVQGYPAAAHEIHPDPET
jgi:hypothetical protein